MQTLACSRFLARTVLNVDVEPYVPPVMAQSIRILVYTQISSRVLDHGERQSVGALIHPHWNTTYTIVSLILANTAELHNKIESMSARIRELEGALAKKPDDPYPLLSGTVSLASRSSVGKASSNSTRVAASSSNEPETDPFIDAFGISD